MFNEELVFHMLTLYSKDCAVRVESYWHDVDDIDSKTVAVPWNSKKSILMESALNPHILTIIHFVNFEMYSLDCKPKETSSFKSALWQRDKWMWPLNLSSSVIRSTQRRCGWKAWNSTRDHFPAAVQSFGQVKANNLTCLLSIAIMFDGILNVDMQKKSYGTIQATNFQFLC